MENTTPLNYLNAVILSGITFEFIKAGTIVSAENLRSKLKGWLISDLDLKLIASNINKIENIERLSETELAEKIKSDPAISAIIIKVQQDNSVNKNAQQDNSVNKIVQNHTGHGNNVSGNLTINNNY